MNATLSRWAQRIDALSLRERVFAFLSIAICLVALADHLVISPSLQQQGLWKLQAQRTETELQAMRTQLSQTMDRPGQVAPQLEARRALVAAEALRAQLLEQLRPASQGGTSTPTSVDALPQLLAKVLQRHQRVTLVKLSTLADASRPAAMTTTAAVTGLSGAPGAAASAPALMPPAPAWQPAQLSLSGSWADLQRFLAALEDDLPGLRWGELRLDGGEGAPWLSVQIWLPPSSGARP